MKSISSICRVYLLVRAINHRIFLLCTFIICFYACKKTDLLAPSNSNPPPTVSDGSIAITAIGTPVGNAVSKIIGPAGGTIISGDSVVELNIPAGALSSNVNVSIQPMTNTAPGSIGLTYDLLPNGTQFSTPAALSFHYSNDSLNGTFPESLWILCQDSSNAWQANQTVQDLDTIARKLNTQISHFSRRSISKNLEISASSMILLQNQKSTINIIEALVFKQPATPYEDGVSIGPITQLFDIPDQNVKNWQVHEMVSHTGNIGTISGTGHQVTYNAPAHVNELTFVRITAQVGPITEWWHRGKIEVPFKTMEIILELDPSEFNYSVYFSYKDSGVAGYIGQLYTDSASFDMKILIQPDAGGNSSQNLITATLLHIQNNGPSVIPETETYPTPDGGSYRWTWVSDPIGLYNIQTVSIDNPVILEDSLIDLTFTSDIGITVGYNSLALPEDGGVHVNIKSIQLPVGLVISPIGPFKISRKEQEIGNPKQGAYFKFTPKP
jgi:hypothetical protein